MRVIHINTKRAGGRYPLQPAWHGRQLLQRVADDRNGNMEGEARVGRRQGVVYVVSANERKAKGKLVVGRIHQHVRYIVTKFNLRGTNLRRFSQTISELDLGRGPTCQ